MYSDQYKIIKITSQRVHCTANDQHSTFRKFRFDQFFRTDFLHLDKWYRLFLEDIGGHPVIQGALLIDKNVVLPYSDYQQEVDQQRKELGLTAREVNMERKYLLMQVLKKNEI